MMKCECCGRAEATFYRRSEINGRVRETHLCEACARAQGEFAELADPLKWLSEPFGLWGEDAFPMPKLTPAARRTLHVAAQQPPEEETPLPEDAETEEIRRERRVNALRLALDEALAREDYEEASKLRDTLRGLGA